MPRGGYLMRGITRANIVRLCQQEGLPLRECDFYLTQVRNWREDRTTVHVSLFPIPEAFAARRCNLYATQVDTRECKSVVFRYVSTLLLTLLAAIVHLQCCGVLAVPCRASSFPQVYGADEAFATGTFAGLLPVVEVDGRRIGTGERHAGASHRRVCTLGAW